MACTTGQHSEEGVEKSLRLSPGELRRGSRTLIETLIKKHLTNVKPAD